MSILKRIDLRRNVSADVQLIFRCPEGALELFVPKPPGKPYAVVLYLIGDNCKSGIFLS